jgi:hypothetical protein
MTKPTTRSARPPVENIKPPRTIDYATVALVTMVVAGVARALLLLGNTSMLTAYAIKQNKNAKNPDKNFDVVKAVHQFREGAIFTALIIGVVLLLLAWALRRTRSASASRWAMLIVFLFTGLPFYIIPTSGLPGPASVAGVVLGIAAVAAVLLIFIPRPSQQYFRACREANTPPEKRGQPRPGLGSLFGPRRPRDAAGTGPSSRAPSSKPDLSKSSPTAAKAKAKVRTDSDAVAKGAELARSRAKASKSRRTTD